MRMTSVSKSPGIHNRSLISDVLVATLDGKLIPNRKICTSCKRLLPVTAFYRESKPKRKHVNSVRSCCVECWLQKNK